MKILLRFAAVLLLLPVMAISQAPELVFQKCLGGSNIETFNCIQPTNDGGYILAGKTMSADGDIPNANGAMDAWIVKVDQSANIVWQRIIGGEFTDEAMVVRQTADGGYIAGIWLQISASNDVGTDTDILIIKLDAAGQTQWQKTISTPYYDRIFDIQETFEGGFIVAAWWPDVPNHINFRYPSYLWVIRLTEAGQTAWEKKFDCLALGNYGAFGASNGYRIRQTSEGGFIIAGSITSNHPIGTQDYWILKLDAAGTLQWEKYLGEFNNNEQAYDIRQTPDGGYIVVGTASCPIDYPNDTYCNMDCKLTKLDAGGNITWEKKLTGTNFEIGYNIRITADGGYLIAGETRDWGSAPSGEIPYRKGSWFLKTDAAGNVLWIKNIDGLFPQGGDCLLETGDGEYIAVGAIMINNCKGGGFDAWIGKFGKGAKPVVKITDPVNPDKYGCATGKLTFHFENEPAAPVQADLHVKYADGTEKVLKNYSITDAGEITFIEELKAGEYHVKCRDAEGEVFQSSVVSLTNPEAQESFVDHTGTTTITDYDCAQGALGFRFVTEDCFETLEVTLYKIRSDGFNERKQTLQITQDNPDITFQDLIAGTYYARVIFDGKEIKSSEETLQNPPKPCDKMSVTTAVDESQFDQKCRDIVTVKLNTAGSCVDTWTVAGGISADGVNFVNQSLEADYKPDQTIPVEIYRLDPEATGDWYISAIQVKYRDEVCILKAQKVETKRLDYCKKDYTFTKRILQQPTNSCTENGIAVFRVNVDDVCLTDVQSIRYILRSPNGYFGDKQVFNKDESVTFDKLGVGTYEIVVGFNQGTRFCPGQEIFEMKAVNDDLLVFPNPVPAGQQTVTFNLTGCFKQPVEVHLRNMFGQTIARKIYPAGDGPFSGSLPFGTAGAGFYTVVAYEGARLLHSKSFMKL